ncbi:MAG: phenylalanine--tRNA ligase beta subunit-related protein [Candidatus Hodarchaeales archaeon]|jgi:DNA/RNA-binding domain of Phe-tRNA-synthetase-like protein
MQIILTPELKKEYPGVSFGSLIIRNVPNKKKFIKLEEKKRNLEQIIRTTYGNIAEDRIIQIYNTYFKKWGKSYPLQFQLNTVLKGRNLPQVSVLVDSMFMAELQNHILTSGHDLDQLQGKLTFYIIEEPEQYLTLSGKEKTLKRGDVILKDESGILASVLYGPTRRTSISSQSKNVLYFAWCPYDIDSAIITKHLTDIFSNVKIAFENVISETKLYS